MNLILFPDTIALCKLKADTNPADWIAAPPLHVTIHDPHGATVICAEPVSERHAAEWVDRSIWRCFQIDEIFGIDSVGVVAEFSGLLASEQISVFVVSSYETDFLLVQPKQVEQAVEIFQSAGHTVSRN